MSKKNQDQQSTTRIFISNFLHNPSGVIGLAIISVMILTSIFAVQISGVAPDYIDPINSRLGPSLDHLMGTDQLGRDMFSRILSGARQSIYIGVLASLFANLIGTILMMILERTKDIGILKTMGADDSTIKLIFLLQGSLITFTGLIIGISISLLFYWLQSQFSIITLPQENYYMSTAPVEPHLIDFVLVTCVTFILSWLASYIPSRVASQINPLKVIAFGKG